jgi:hypothetical protein
MGKRLTPSEKRRRTMEKNRRAADRIARKLERERKAEEKKKRAARGPCKVCGKTHRDAYKYWECEQKLSALECTCPAYWHRTGENGTRWFSHSYTHGCPLAEKGNEEAARQWNLRSFGDPGPY